MLKLNLPSYEYQIKNEKGTLYIYDDLRRKYLLLTPEEWVRQHFIHFLLKDKGVPPKLVKQEAKLNYHNVVKWADILVYDPRLNPVLLIECKASTEQLDQDVFHQVITYNHVLEVPFLGITNGLNHFYAQKQEGAGYQLIPELPVWQEMKGE